tara:strand:- start:954 stop:1091 length:138 start_codon:yes stop_codon:yes gene_type:complete
MRAIFGWRASAEKRMNKKIKVPGAAQNKLPPGPASKQMPVKKSAK